MTKSLAAYEDSFMEAFRGITVESREKTGVLLTIIPNRADWDDFLLAVKTEWMIRGGISDKYPHCLVILYAGIAFYEYEDNTLWPQFRKAIGSTLLLTNIISNINAAFSMAARNLGLKILRRKRTEYVGSAIYHIGIPLSLWDGFLELCEWARCRDDWNTLSDEEWSESIGKRTGGRLRLKRFLIDNREVATAFIKEMLDAREVLSENLSLSVKDIARVCLLRPEYFNEVPETADFLRPQNPESLYLEQVRLIWNEQKRCISLHLPAVAPDNLPANWSIGELTPLEAAATPDELILNSAAFNDPLVLRLNSKKEIETQRLKGIKPFGLYDLERGMFINPKREQLPLKSYDLISSEKFDNIFCDGFDNEEYSIEELFELRDGTTCFITRLRPTGKVARVTLTREAESWKLNFNPSSRIEARFFIGEGSDAAKFSYNHGLFKIDQLPLLCVAIPFGFFNNNESVLSKKFQVFVDDNTGYGRWEKRGIDESHDYYVWRWHKTFPVRDKNQPDTYRSLKDIQDIIKSPDLQGNRIISIKASELGVKFEYPVEILTPQTRIDKYWCHLPGLFLLWFLLEQATDGMKWTDLTLAKDIIAPTSDVSYSLLRKFLHKYSEYGLIRQQGQTWHIAESRTVISESDYECSMQYCGKPSILWGLLRNMLNSSQNNQHNKKGPRRIIIRAHQKPMQPILVKSKRGELPYLVLTCAKNQKDNLEHYLKENNVNIVSNLWRS